MRNHTISLLHSERTNSARRVELTSDDLCRALCTYQTRASKSGGAWSPIVWEDDTRSSDAAESVTALVYDLDHVDGPMMARCGATLEREGWRYALHETFTRGRYRLALPLAVDVGPREYPLLWANVATMLGITPDPTGVDLARLFYLPAQPPDETRESEHGGRVLLDPREVGLDSLNGRGPGVEPDPLPSRPAPQGAEENHAGDRVRNAENFDLDVLRAAVSRLKGENRRQLLEALSFRLLLKKGERENALHRLVSALVVVLPETAGWVEVREIFAVVVRDMEGVEDHGVDYYMGRVRYSFDRAMERKQREDDHREAAQAFFQVDPGSPDAWRTRLITTHTKNGPAVKACSANLDLILECDASFKGFIQFNGLSRRVEITGGVLGFASRETNAIELSLWLQRSEYAIDIGREVCGNALLAVAKRHEYNPVSEYLEGLQWDGTPRIEKALHTLCGAQGNQEYIRNISRKFFIAAAARALEPGCKVDTVLVLQGKQGTGKTSFVEELAGGWYTTVHARVDDKDTRMQATGSWIVELSELASASKSTTESMRGFLTQRSDDIRVPYAVNIENYPRRCIFVGTTNSDSPLSDPEGNRRYWVVSTDQFNIRELRKQRDQLWAEAVTYYRLWQQEDAAGTPDADQKYRWWFSPSEQRTSDDENSIYQIENPMVHDIEYWASKLEPTSDGGYLAMSATEIAKKALHASSERLASDPGIIVKLGKTLTEMGWQRSCVTVRGRSVYKYIIPNKPSLTNPTQADT